MLALAFVLVVVGTFRTTQSVSAVTDDQGPSLDLCAFQKDFQFFSGLARESSTPHQERVSSLRCDDLWTTRLIALPDTSPAPAEVQDFSLELQAIVRGFPIETMVQTIAEYDRDIAGLIVGIGKKESNWGKRTPKLSGEECFNFWGYRGSGDRGLTADGYGCWTVPERAVRAIGDRLTNLRDLRASADPARMVVWKCGRSCASHSPESVAKWIADVNLYYREIAGKP